MTHEVLLPLLAFNRKVGLDNFNCKVDVDRTLGVSERPSGQSSEALMAELNCPFGSQGAVRVVAGESYIYAGICYQFIHLAWLHCRKIGAAFP